MNVHTLSAAIVAAVRAAPEDSAINLETAVTNMIADAMPSEAKLLDSIASIQELHVTPGAMELHIKQHPALAHCIAQCFAEIVRKAPNYTEMKFDIVGDHDSDKPMWITVTVQKGNGLTPHQKRQEAEAKHDAITEIAARFLVAHRDTSKNWIEAFVEVGAITADFDYHPLYPFIQPVKYTP